ncbi:hypothetical protein BD769DRAFT_1388975 [Suillus cothurnatus]|nr:hypothetical protein BD769DRAFT_1388975 [Suillus cothurnatus]
MKNRFDFPFNLAMDTTPNSGCEFLLNQSQQNPQSTTHGQEVSKRPVPSPSRLFHVVCAPGQAKEHPPSPEVLYPLPPFRQTPGPIKLLECMQGPATHQAFMQEQIARHWNAEKKWCEEFSQLVKKLGVSEMDDDSRNQGQ